MRHSGDGRTSFTNGAIFLVSIGEPRIQSEVAYPGVSTVIGDIRRCGFERLRLFPTHTAVPLSTAWLSEALSRTSISLFCRRQSPPHALLSGCSVRVPLEVNTRKSDGSCPKHVLFSRAFLDFQAFRAAIKKAPGAIANSRPNEASTRTPNRRSCPSKCLADQLHVGDDPPDVRPAVKRSLLMDRC